MSRKPHGRPSVGLAKEAPSLVGFNALHQDIRGDVFVPIQLVAVLRPRASGPDDFDGFTGGEFLLRDEGERQAIPAGLGDAILFCTSGRLKRLATGYALQPVKRGLSRLESGPRLALGIPFHEFRGRM
jgi:hypothetical protein